MTCHCGLGLSARAIAYSGHTDHPHDPADLRRCVIYCQQTGITIEALQRRMAGRSPEWDALLPHWDELSGLLRHEMTTRTDGLATETYARMRWILDSALAPHVAARRQTGDLHEGHISLEASKHQPEPGACTCGFCAYSSEHVAVMVWRDLIEPHVAAQVEQRDAEPDWMALQVAEMDACPNCITPWKCNGPHVPRVATFPAPELQREGDDATPVVPASRYQWLAERHGYMVREHVRLAAERDAALARVDAARRDALAPVLALLPTPTTGGALGCIDGHGLSAESVRILRGAVESPDRPEGERP